MSSKVAHQTDSEEPWQHHKGVEHDEFPADAGVLVLEAETWRQQPGRQLRLERDETRPVQSVTTRMKIGRSLGEPVAPLIWRLGDQRHSP